MKIKMRYATGMPVDVPRHDVATYAEDSIIGDKEALAGDCGRQLNEDRLSIWYFTGDGDSKAFTSKQTYEDIQEICVHLEI